MKVNPDIFRTYDIRGVNEKDLNKEVVNLIGKGFGTYLQGKGTKDVVVGRDTRLTSEKYQGYLIDGLTSTGCNVHDVGLSLSSAIYHARHFYKIDGGVYVTASHNPPNYNGVKLLHGIKAIYGEEIQKVKKIIEAKKFKKGKGKIKKLSKANEEYYQAIKKRVRLKKKLKVLLDCGHGTPALFIPKFLEKLGCEVISIHEKIDPSFPAGVSDPVNAKYCQAAAKATVKNKADMGVILDVDGDRAGFVDEKGRVWLGDIILDIFIRDFLPRNPGAKVIVELKDSEIVVDDTKKPNFLENRSCSFRRKSPSRKSSFMCRNVLSLLDY
jgi:phosphomannomutase/phosphoglucomutase